MCVQFITTANEIFYNMSSHPKSKVVNKITEGKHLGGPLKRINEQASLWNSVIGTSLDSTPASQLPSIRTVLRRYRALRIDHVQDNTYTLAKIITSEVTNIWNRACVPTTSYDNCVRKVVEAITLWKCNHNPADLARDDFQTKLDKLLDLKPKLRGKTTTEAELDNLKTIMRQSSEKKTKRPDDDTYDWEKDYDSTLTSSRANAFRH